MKVSQKREAAIRAALTQKARAHSELRKPLSDGGLRAILRRERLRVVVRSHPKPAQLLPMPEGWTIVLDEQTTDAERFVLACHELAHYWLHADIDEIVTYDYSPPWYDELREAEADYLTEQLIAGPTTPIHPKGERVKRAAVPTPPAPDWLDDTRDADAIRVTARETQRAYAREHPVSTEPRIAFSIRRDQWQQVCLPAGHGALYSPMVSIPIGVEYEYVECDVTAARAIVEQLARAGYKRTAVFVRRRVRETRHQLPDKQETNR